MKNKLTLDKCEQTEAILRFNLSDEYSKEDFKDALNGTNYKRVIEDLIEFLRQKYKYGNRTYIKIEDIRAKINELMDEYGVK